jgi:hypothetical protein
MKGPLESHRRSHAILLIFGQRIFFYQIARR